MINSPNDTSNLTNIFIFLSARPLLSALFRPRFEEPPSQYRRIRQQLKSKQQLISLSMGFSGSKSFMCEYFAVDDIHPCLPFVMNSGGNPTFVEWICELIDVHYIL